MPSPAPPHPRPRPHQLVAAAALIGAGLIGLYCGLSLLVSALEAAPWGALIAAGSCLLTLVGNLILTRPDQRGALLSFRAHPARAARLATNLALWSVLIPAGTVYLIVRF